MFNLKWQREFVEKMSKMRPVWNSILGRLWWCSEAWETALGDLLNLASGITLMWQLRSLLLISFFSSYDAFVKIIRSSSVFLQNFAWKKLNSSFEKFWATVPFKLHHSTLGIIFLFFVGQYVEQFVLQTCQCLVNLLGTWLLHFNCISSWDIVGTEK